MGRIGEFESEVKRVIEGCEIDDGGDGAPLARGGDEATEK